jgi:hypothetical protein
MEDDGNFIADAELNNYINSAITEWHDLIVEVSGEDVFLTSTTVAGTGAERYALPAGFHLLRGVEQTVGTDKYPLRPHAWNKRTRGAGTTGTTPGDYTYRLEGVSATTGYTPYIRFAPALATGDSVTVWYVPQAIALTDDAHVFDDLGGWGEFVVVAAALKCLAKEESDQSALGAERGILEQRIRSLASVRDVTEAERVADVFDYESIPYSWR